MYYLKEVNPEFSNDNLFFNGKNGLSIENDIYAENIIIKGNRDYLSYEPKGLEDLQHSIENFNSDYQGYYGQKEKITDAVNWYFKKLNGKQWSKKELHQWNRVAELTENYSRNNEEEAFLLALKLITGKEWRSITLRGCSQGDWQNGYASEELTKEDIEYIEMCYFNTGREFNLYDSEEDCENEENSLTSFYIPGYNEKRELADLLGCNENELLVYAFNGYTQIAQYKLA